MKSLIWIIVMFHLEDLNVYSLDSFDLVTDFREIKNHRFHLFTVNVHMPKDRVTQSHQGYGFVEFMGEDDADYAIKIMNMIKLYGKPIRVNKVRMDDFLPIYYCSQYIQEFHSTCINV